MKRRYPLLVLAGWMALASGAAAQFDTIKTVSGVKRGRVKSISPAEVVIEVNAVDESVKANEIITIFYRDEPSALYTAKTNVTNGAYENGLEQLDRIEPADATRPEIQADLAFYKAYCTAQLALGGSARLDEAINAMSAFAATYARTSYHYLQAYEALGNLYAAAGRFAEAEKAFDMVARAPFPDCRMRAGVAIGRARLAQGKLPEAQQAFDAVLAMEANDDLTRAQRRAATLGKARCVAAAGNAAAAIKVVREIIANADPEDVDLHARAYNTLGDAYRKAGNDKEALMAFLHVDLIYHNVPEAHAEALANLNDLWTKFRKTERAVRCRQLLQERYANSRWAKALGGSGG